MRSSFDAYNIRFLCMQVLESSVFPVLLAFGSRSAIQESKLLNMDTAGRPTEEKLADRQAGWRALQCLQRMRDWIFYAIAACPGVAAIHYSESAYSGIVHRRQGVRFRNMQCCVWKTVSQTSMLEAANIHCTASNDCAAVEGVKTYVAHMCRGVCLSRSHGRHPGDAGRHDEGSDIQGAL